MLFAVTLIKCAGDLALSIDLHCVNSVIFSHFRVFRKPYVNFYSLKSKIEDSRPFVASQSASTASGWSTPFRMGLASIGTTTPWQGILYNRIKCDSGRQVECGVERPGRAVPDDRAVNIKTPIKHSPQSPVVGHQCVDFGIRFRCTRNHKITGLRSKERTILAYR
jgi:hypothetical protein